MIEPFLGRGNGNQKMMGMEYRVMHIDMEWDRVNSLCH